MKAPYIEKLQTIDGISVWLVDGRWVEEHCFMDFMYGGHDLVYDFIPPKEAWIDDRIGVAERPYIIDHELHERRRMASGVKYSQAHDDATRVEALARGISLPNGKRLNE